MSSHQNQSFTPEEDEQIRETFLELRKACFELEKEKFRRMENAAHRKMGVPEQYLSSSSSTKEKGNKKNVDDDANDGIGVFDNWKRVLLLAFFILLFNWKRLVNLFDIAFNPEGETQNVDVVDE